jgi:hypothetical protein
MSVHSAGNNAAIWLFSSLSTPRLRILTGTFTTRLSAGNSPWRCRYLRKPPLTIAMQTSLSVLPEAFLIALSCSRGKTMPSNTRWGPTGWSNRVFGPRVWQWQLFLCHLQGSAPQFSGKLHRAPGIGHLAAHAIGQGAGHEFRATQYRCPERVCLFTRGFIVRMLGSRGGDRAPYCVSPSLFAGRDHRLPVHGEPSGAPQSCLRRSPRQGPTLR